MMETSGDEAIWTNRSNGVYLYSTDKNSRAKAHPADPAGAVWAGPQFASYRASGQEFGPGTAGRIRFGLLLLFAGSGCASLIYEIVWFQWLQLVIGSTAVSIAVLLATFMGGMCLGSLGFAKLVSARRHPLRVYGLLEIGIGLLGLGSLFVAPWAGRFYLANSGPGIWGIMVRAGVSAVCLLPPTLLMGATLPAMARWLETRSRSLSWLGLFYGANFAGAVFGCLLAGFYLLRIYDMAIATYAAVAINAAVGLIGLGLARAPCFDHAELRFPQTDPSPAGASGDSNTRALGDAARPHAGALSHSSSWAVYVAIALSGACALGAEVVWTRLLSLLLGPTVYTFSIILAVFLVGLGMGSGIGSLLARALKSPMAGFGWCQLLLAAAIAWTAGMIGNSLPYWPIDPSLSQNSWFNFQLDLVRCAWAILPATILWGASFPLALAATRREDQDSGAWVGKLYAANTCGAIAGALACSLLLIAWLGTQQTQRLLATLSAAGGLMLLGPGFFAWRKNRSWLRKLASTGLFLVLLLGAALLAWSIPSIPAGLIAYGRYLPGKNSEAKTLYAGEGMNASVAVTELSTGVRNFHVSGKVEASTEPHDMRMQRMLGHLPAMLHRDPKSVLVVGCGAGVTAGSFVVHPGIERIVICEIEPLIPKIVARYFGKQNYNVLQDPRVQVVYDDARHYILTTREKFDVITSDPIHPWVKGAATLYTQEYFELVKNHLNPGGLVTQWVPLYESNREVVQSEIATFFAAFPGGTIWSNEQDGEGYDVVLLGGMSTLKIDLDDVQQRLRGNERLSQSLEEVGIRSVFSLLGTYAGRAADLGPWLRDAMINRDSNLRLQYLAGLGLNMNQRQQIYEQMLSSRSFPEELFIGSGERKQALKRVIQTPATEK